QLGASKNKYRISRIRGRHWHAPSKQHDSERLSMQLEQVWQAALGQLQMEIPKSTFDTWVRGTTLLTHEDGSYVVGVANAYAKDWLENRMRTMVTRTLCGIVGRTVEVRFVVWPADGSGTSASPLTESAALPFETAAAPA